MAKSTDKDQPQTRFTGLWIPAELLEIRELHMTTVMLAAWIHALDDPNNKHGGCFASNEFLADKLRVKPNTVAKALTELRKLKIIEDKSFDGRTRVIKSRLNKFLADHESNADLDSPSQSNAGLDSDPRGVGLESNATLDLNPSDPINAEDPHISTVFKAKKREKKKDDGGEPPNPPASSTRKSSSKSRKEPKLSKDKPGAVERREAVHVTDDEHDKLVKEHGQQLTEACYDKLNAAKQSKGLEYKSDYHTIINWVVNAVQKDQKQGYAGTKSRAQVNVAPEHKSQYDKF